MRFRIYDYVHGQERLGENDGRLWDAVCQVALRSFDRPFGEYLGKSCVAVRLYVCVPARSFYFFERKVMYFY